MLALALLAGVRPSAGLDLSLVVEPAALAEKEREAGALASVMEMASQAGIRRILTGPVPAALNAAKGKDLAAWTLLPVLGPVDGLRDAHWAAPREGGAPLAGLPCYALPEARAALLRAATRCLDLPGEGIFLLLDGPVAWPEGNAAARDYGYNPAVVEEYQRRYGSDPRKAEPDSLAQMFFIRLKGEHLAAAIREVAAEARRRGKRVGLALPFSETNVRTAVHAYLDVEGLIREKVVDEVALSGQPRFNLLRWKVQAEPPPTAGLWATIPADGKGLRATLAAALENATADGLALDALPALAAGRWKQIPEAAKAWETQRREKERFAAALASGEYRVVAGVPEAKGADQATTHGVAQSFALEQPADVVAVRLFLALRAAADAEVPDIAVELRADRDGKPLGDVLAAGTVTPFQVSAEPSYRWAAAQFPSAVRLEAGRTYWIHAPNAPGYVWRIDPSASYPRGNAWSSRYDYAKHDWVFEVLASR